MRNLVWKIAEYGIGRLATLHVTPAIVAISLIG